MTQLQRLERDILELQDRLTLRRTLDLATKIGERLIEAKKLLAHGEWLSWLARMGTWARTTGLVAAFGGPRRPSPAIFPGVGDFWKRLLASFSGLGVGAGRLGLGNNETRASADRTAR
jgi:hypothetical protein